MNFAPFFVLDFVYQGGFVYTSISFVLWFRSLFLSLENPFHFMYLMDRSLVIIFLIFLIGREGFAVFSFTHPSALNSVGRGGTLLLSRLEACCVSWGIQLHGIIVWVPRHWLRGGSRSGPSQALASEPDKQGWSWADIKFCSPHQTAWFWASQDHPLWALACSSRESSRLCQRFAPLASACQGSDTGSHPVSGGYRMWCKILPSLPKR